MNAERTRLPSALLLPLAILLCTVLALTASAPPAPRGMDAPPEDFSAARAAAELAEIARAPHPMGSAEHARVRDHLVARLTALGFATEVQRTPVHYAVRERAASFAFVDNVIGVKPGTAGGGAALVLMAHYDSRLNAPGAGDDGSGTAAILEIVRALTATPLARDLVVLFTDGEEMGLYGAQAFVASHPLAARTGLVINLEARGSRGPALLFETSADNAALIAGAAAALPRPVTSSLFYEAYRLMPNDTDLSATKAAGLPGLNVALVGGFFDYHSPTDTPENFSPDTLQHLGEYGLTLARHFGMRELPATADHDVVYFDILGRWLVHYPVPLGHALTLLALVALALLIGRARGAGVADFAGTARGLLGFLLLLISVAVMATALFEVLGGSADAREPRFWWGIAWLEWQTLGYALFALGATLLALHGYARALAVRGILVRAGFLLLVLLAGGALDWRLGLAIAGVAGAELALFRRPHQPWELALGALTLWAILGVAASLVAPSASHTFVLPLLGALAGHHWALSRPAEARSAIVGGALWGLLTLGFLVPFLHLALGYAAPAMPAAVVALGLGLVVPVAITEVAQRRQVLASTSLLAGVALLVALALLPPWSARHPLPQDLFLIVDHTRGEALFASADRRRDAWQQRFVPAEATQDSRARLFPGSTAPLWVAPAQLDVTPAPLRVESLGRASDGTGERLRVRMVPPSGALLGQLWIETDAELTGLVLEGHGPLPLGQRQDGAGWRITWHALPPEGAVLALTLARPAPVALRSLTLVDGWPAPHSDAVAARAPHTMATHNGYGHRSVVVARSVLE